MTLLHLILKSKLMKVESTLLTKRKRGFSQKSLLLMSRRRVTKILWQKSEISLLKIKNKLSNFTRRTSKLIMLLKLLFLSLPLNFRREKWLSKLNQPDLRRLRVNSRLIDNNLPRNSTNLIILNLSLWLRFTNLTKENNNQLKSKKNFRFNKMPFSLRSRNLPKSKLALIRRPNPLLTEKRLLLNGRLLKSSKISRSLSSNKKAWFTNNKLYRNWNLNSRLRRILLSKGNRNQMSMKRPLSNTTKKSVRTSPTREINSLNVLPKR